MQLDTEHKQALGAGEKERDRRPQRTPGKRKRNDADEKGVEDPNQVGASRGKQLKQHQDGGDEAASAPDPPPGFVTMVRESQGRRAVFFAVSCHGSDFRLDRMARIKKFLEKHGSCRPEWQALGQQKGESREQHLQRLKQHFYFNAEQSVGTVGTVQEEVAAKAELPAAKKQKEADRNASTPQSPAAKRQKKADKPATAPQLPPIMKQKKAEKVAATVRSPAKQPGSHEQKPAKRAAAPEDELTHERQAAGTQEMPLHEPGSKQICTDRVALPAKQPAAVEPAPVTQPVNEESAPSMLDPEVQQTVNVHPMMQEADVEKQASDQVELAEVVQWLTRQEWEAEQDMMELGRHLQDSHDTFQQRCNSFHMFLEIDAATAIAAEELVGRQVRVLWPHDSAWFLGSVSSYNPEDGKHEVRYEDGDVENVLMAATRIRLEVCAGETLIPPSASDISLNAEHVFREAKERAEDREEAQEMRSRAEELRSLAEQAAAVAAAAAEHQAENPAAAPDAAAADAPEAVFGLGEVVWAREKGWPAWPSVVITRESARDLSNLRPCKGGVTVWFFGTYEMGCIKPAEVVGLRAGLEQELHAKCKRSVKVFRRALHEAYVYLRTGKPPDQMVLDSNDESWFADADEAPDQDFTGANFPLRLGKNLTVNSLGRIEYLRQDFHNKKYLWPLGYSAVRTENLPSGKRLVCHCQILSSPDSLAPIFRVTAEGAKPVEADHPGRAWKEVFRRAGAERRVAGMSGPRMFGLDNPAIACLIQALPNAGRCAGFDAWLGERPPCDPLSPEEERQRLALEAAVQRLPAGIRALPAARAIQGVCSVCGEEEETEQNHLLQCDGCRQFVHMDCYGVPAPPEGRLWLCDVCKLGPSRAPACALCPVEGGLLKRTTCNRWVHSACTLWVPETAVDMDRGLVDGLQYIPKGRFQLSCSVCSQAYGACIQCAGHRSCCASFHPLCARSAGLCMVAVRDEYESDSEAEDEAASPSQESDENRAPNCALPAPTQPQKDAQQKIITLRADCSGDSGVSPMDSGSDARPTTDARLDELPRSSDASEQTNCTHPEGQDCAAGELVLQRSQANAARSSQKAAQEAAAVGGEGAREAEVPAANGTVAHAKACAPAGPLRVGAVAAKAARPKRVWREGTALSAGLRLMCYCGKHTALLGPSTVKSSMSIVTGRPVRGLHSRAAPAAPMPQSTAPAVPFVPAAAGTNPGGKGGEEAPCSRCGPYNHELRRGHRAPDAIAAALAKRAFVCATPYLVTVARVRPVACPPPAVRRHSARQLSELFREARAQADRSNAGKFLPAKEGDVADEDGLPAAGGGQPVQSLAERFKEMRRTITERLTCGKSAIHGWGAFTKVPAAASDMLVEYMGELVRRPVADARERRIYDRLVGAGTYVFGLSDELVVDATRKGNMAHLLNHSCEPNSYSRTISVRCPDTGRLCDHVVIFAKRAIAAGEELTYDYRFSGEEQLPCNCGAATCRGFVNLPKASADSEAQLVLRSRLKPYITPAARQYNAAGKGA